MPDKIEKYDRDGNLLSQEDLVVELTIEEQIAQKEAELLAMYDDLNALKAQQ